jgi:hypothetical protein
MWPKFRLVGNCPPPDLLGCTTAGGVGDGPGRLLPGLELGLRLDVYQHREYVRVYHGLKKVKYAVKKVKNYYFLLGTKTVEN